ncbi:hypothetical protein MferCBS49748_001870 [Microsporum ferrugineum]
MESPSAIPEGHRAYLVTDTDQGGHIVIVSTLLMSWMVLCFFIRIYIRSDINGPFGLDDSVVGIGSELRWQVITAFDVMTELLIFGMLVYLIWGLQMVMSRKVIIVSAFACRLPVVGFSIFRLTTIHGVVDLRDPTLSMVPYVIWTEILLHYSIMAATIPCLKPFFIAFNTGWGQGSHKRTSRYPPYNSRTSSKTGPNFSNKLGKIMGSPQSDFRNDTSGTRSISQALNRGGAPSVESHESQQMIIRETRGWTVEHESFEMRSYGNMHQA